MKRFSALLCILLAFALVFSLTACENGEGGSSSAAPSGSASDASEEDASSEESGPAGRVDVSDVRWEAVGMINQKMIEAGVGAGEGCQWTLSVCYAYSEPDLCFFGTDVGGFYRSKDGGTTWEPCTRGVVCAAGNNIAVDPKNSSRVLVVGMNGGAVRAKECGLYLSTDKGDSFHQVLTERLTGWRDNRVQIAFDPTSYDSAKGYCTTIYWSKETMNYAPSPYGVANGGNNTPILYKSTDGGETWSAVSTSPNISGARIAVEPGSGAVLAAGEKGLWRSTDGGKSFTCVMEGLVTSVTTCLTKPGTAWATKLDGLYRSTDGGATFVNLNASGYPTGEKAYPAQVTVSPADPNTVYVATDYQTWAYALGKATNFAGDCSYYYSHDGGATFEKAYIDRSNTFYNHVNHQAYIAAHPTDKNRVLALGGDVIIRSTDGGENYREVGAGYNGGCWTGMGINLNDPNLIMLSNQDYTGAFSADGGKTWKSLLNIGNKLTLYSYGCYPVSASVLLIVARDDNNLYKKGAGKYVLMRSEDGGKTFLPTDAVFSGTTPVTGMYGNNNVVFAGGLRSTDGGATWAPMSGCDRVCTAAKNGTVYGFKGYKIVRSADAGVTWEALCTVSDGGLADMAYCEADGSLWTVGSAGVVTHIVNGEPSASLPFNNCDAFIDSVEGRSIACDPVENIVYVGGIFRTATEKGGILRSKDGGKTWAFITRTTENNVANEGPYGSSFLRVSPTTRELYTIGSCRGLWKTKP